MNKSNESNENLDDKLPVRPVGRPPLNLDIDKARKLHEEGASYEKIARDLRVCAATVYNRLNPRVRSFVSISRGTRELALEMRRGRAKEEKK